MTATDEMESAEPDRTRKGGAARAVAAAHEPAGGLDMGALPGLVGYALRRAQVAVFTDFNASLAELDLRPAQFSVLLLVRHNPGRKQSDLAEALGIQRPNFATMMDELDRRGLTRRTTSRTDRRSYVIQLTAAGERRLDEALALVAEHEARIRRDVDPAEVDRLVDVLGRIHRAASGR